MASTIYMAIYERAGREHNDRPYLTTLLLSPANSKANGNNSYRYFANNPWGRGPPEKWVVEKEEEFPNRTFQLRSVTVLGQTRMTGEEFYQVLLGAPLNDYIDPAWRDHSWIWSTIDYLVTEGVISALLPGFTGRGLWFKARDSTLAHTKDTIDGGFDPWETPLYTLNRHGDEIKAAMRGIS